MLLSIVITTYNRSNVLCDLLQHLESQTDTHFQVVVAIDGSTDNTEAALTALTPSYDLKWVNTHCDSYGLAVARNMGILAADGEAVVVLDDDSFPDSGFVAAHKSSVSSRVITGGPRQPANSADAKMTWKMTELGKLPYCRSMAIQQLQEDWPNAYLIENNVCLYRHDWVAIGLFSERLKMYGFIGQEFFGRAEYLGFKYQYNHDAKVMHHGELEGDNGLQRRSKHRQVRVAIALRPTLMQKKYYDKQVEWARRVYENDLLGFRYPPFLLTVSLMFPYRFLKQLLSEYKRKLRSYLK